MKEKENTSTSNKKRVIYTVIVAVCALLLIAATVLTVYFLTQGNRNVLDTPPAQDSDKKDPPTSGDDPKDDPSKPSGGVKVAFVKPVESTVCSVEYEEIYDNTSTNKWYKHMAIDYLADEGTAVCAMADGVVKEISLTDILGNCVVIEHADGVTSIYRFVEPVTGLKAGDKVKQGQTIATVAAAYGTEYKDGTHLHLEMSVNGKSVDPKDYIDVTFEEK